MVSISSTSTNATDHEAAFSLISFARASREFASSFFESSIPVMRVPGFRITAAAETGTSGLLDHPAECLTTYRKSELENLGLLHRSTDRAEIVDIVQELEAFRGEVRGARGFRGW